MAYHERVPVRSTSTDLNEPDRLLQQALAAPTTVVLARKEKAQQCVSAARQALILGQFKEAGVLYNEDGALSREERLYFQSGATPPLPFQPVVHVFRYLKARMFLADSHAMTALLALCSSTLTAAYKLPVVRSSGRDISIPDFDRTEMWPDLVYKCRELSFFLVNLMKYSLALRGAVGDLTTSLTTASFGLLVRMLQWLLPRTLALEGTKYQLLVHQFADVISEGFGALFAVLSRSGQLWSTMQKQVDVPGGQIRAIITAFARVTKTRPGWAQLEGPLDGFAGILGYCHPRGKAELLQQTIAERATYYLGQELKCGGYYQKHGGKAVHLCLCCGKGGVDKEGEEMVSHCSFCHCTSLVYLDMA